MVVRPTARVIVLDAEGRVLLFQVEDQLLSDPGGPRVVAKPRLCWVTPGGGVEAGETTQVSLARELSEEGGITPLGPVVLHGVFFNARVSRRDHVVVYVLRHFRQQGVPQNPREIIGHGFFARDALPADTTRGTRARIAEVFDGAPITEQW